MLLEREQDKGGRGTGPDTDGKRAQEKEAQGRKRRINIYMMTEKKE